MRTVYVDCTNTYIFNETTGIQRVVRSIVVNLPAVAEAIGMRCQPVYFTDGSYYLLQEPLIVRRKPFVKTKIIPLLRPVFKIIKFFLSARGARVMSQSAMALLTRPPKTTPTSLAVSFAKGDILVIPDSFWNIPYGNIFMHLRRKGVSVGLLIHDLIPIYHPEFCVVTVIADFTYAMKHMFPELSFSIAISEATNRDIRTYMQEEQLTTPAKQGVVHNGVDAALGDSATNASVSGEVVRLFSSDAPTFLCVGTIEPRKNHAYVLEAFTALWKRGSSAKVVFIGKVGWKCDRLIAQIESHPEYGKHLFVLHAATDTDLQYAYEHAAALIAASVIEGFDLPVVESLQQGTPVLASDIPVHREIAGDFAAYFDLRDPASLAKLIEDKAYLSTLSPSEFTWPSWRESTEKLVREAIRLSDVPS